MTSSIQARAAVHILDKDWTAPTRRLNMLNIFRMTVEQILIDGCELWTVIQTKYWTTHTQQKQNNSDALTIVHTVMVFFIAKRVGTLPGYAILLSVSSMKTM